MKIAVASENKLVCEHFGHCESFMVYHIEDNVVVKKENIPNPGHRPGFLPVFLHGLGVNVIIAGGMGGGAVELFDENNIKVITGARGEADNTVIDYLEGTLISSGSVCHEHQHHDECGN